MLIQRKNLRLHDYDYGQNGCYFVTICSFNRAKIFGDIQDNAVLLTPLGNIVQEEIKNFSYNSEISVDAFVVMPNHIHLILVIDSRPERSGPFPTISEFIGLYKSRISKIIHKTGNDIPIWQKSFHDRIIRNEQEYREVWQYIDENPLNRINRNDKQIGTFY
jgi:REP element-mobilizing transposase RayT